MITFGENQTACVDALALSRKLRANLCHCISDEQSTLKGKASDVLFILLEYRFLLSRNISHTGDEKERSKLEVEKADSECVSRSDHCE